MGVQITIRDVPEDVRDELASRAALERRSMQEYLKRELERLVSRPSLARWVEDTRARKELEPKRVKASAILQARKADRR